jgi:hypothetical protein
MWPILGEIRNVADQILNIKELFFEGNEELVTN